MGMLLGLFMSFLVVYGSLKILKHLIIGGLKQLPRVMGREMDALGGIGGLLGGGSGPKAKIFENKPHPGMGMNTGVAGVPALNGNNMQTVANPPASMGANMPSTKLANMVPNVGGGGMGRSRCNGRCSKCNRSSCPKW